jgi:pimeloyl-ACP methyl ester carboxylesterase
VFHPVACQPETGLIFYPGGRVDPRSYAPPARAIAEKCSLVVIVPMPLNLAVFGSNRAAGIIASYPEIKRWAISGHSLGGAMAAHFAAKNPNAVKGIAFWAAYPASRDNLSSSGLQITSISGSLDGRASPEKIAASRPMLPAVTTWVPIEGGNHAQFGWYGPQPGDNPAAISRESQQAQTVKATLDLLARLNP